MTVSTTEILEQLPRLAAAERAKVWEVLEQLELGGIDETPAMLAAIDAGQRSIKEGNGVTVEEARKLISKWTSRSS